MGDTAAIQFTDLQFPTSDGRIHIASPEAQADGLPLIPEPHADIRPTNGLLRLLSPASPWLLNDSFGNDDKIEVQLGEASVALNPEDAAARGLNNGQTVALHNQTGRLEVKLRLDEGVPKGVALSPKGRWPKRQSDSANVNVLNPGEKSDMGESTCVHSVEVEVSSV